jgi:hypothetical protein
MQNARCSPVSVPETKSLGMALSGAVRGFQYCTGNYVVRQQNGGTGYIITDTPEIRKTLWHFLYSIFNTNLYIF